MLRRQTLKDVSRKAGVSESFLSQVERGRSSASVATLQRLADALGIEISDLFANDGLPKPHVLRREARDPIVWGHLGRKMLLTPKPFHALEVLAAEFGQRLDRRQAVRPATGGCFVIAGASMSAPAPGYDLRAGDSVTNGLTPHRVTPAATRRCCS
jgi:transcriptional regulator with XRE-family HTH domain